MASINILPPPTVPFTVLQGGQQVINNEWYLALNALFLTINAGAASGDVSGVWPNLEVLSTNGVDFAPSATIDATNASNISTGTLPANRLPTPTFSTIGGVTAIGASPHVWINSIGTNGVPTQSQPSVSDLNNTTTGTGSIVLNAQPNIIGVTNGADAAVGSIGEYHTVNVPFASSVVLSTTTTTLIANTPILSAGDWEIGGNAYIGTNGATTELIAWISLTSATPDSSAVGGIQLPSTTGVSMGITCPTIRISTSGVISPQLYVIAVFTTGAASACGNIWARRIR